MDKQNTVREKRNIMIILRFTIARMSVKEILILDMTATVRIGQVGA